MSERDTSYETFARNTNVLTLYEEAITESENTITNIGVSIDNLAKVSRRVCSEYQLIGCGSPRQSVWQRILDDVWRELMYQYILLQKEENALSYLRDKHQDLKDQLEQNEN